MLSIYHVAYGVVVQLLLICSFDVGQSRLSSHLGKRPGFAHQRINEHEKMRVRMKLIEEVVACY